MQKILLFSLLLIGLTAWWACSSDTSNGASTAKATTTEATTAAPEAKPTATTEPQLKDGTYTVEVNASILKWTGRKKMTNDSHTGTLKFKEGSFSVKDGAIVSGKAVIDMNSIDNDDQKGKWKKKLLTHLKSPDFFDVANHPTAEVVVKSRQNDSKYLADVTIRGQTHEVAIPATVSMNGDNLVIELPYFEIDRTQWGVKYNSEKFFQVMKDRIIKDEIGIAGKLVLKPNVTD